MFREHCCVKCVYNVLVATAPFWFICDKMPSVLSLLFQNAAKKAAEEEQKVVKKKL